MAAEKLSATIDSETFHQFEQVRKVMGFENRSQAVQTALKHFTRELMMKRLEQEAKEAKGTQTQKEVSEFIKASEEFQGEALESKFG